MHTISLLRGSSNLLLCLVCAVASCSNAEQDKAKIAEIQRQADERVAKAERDARERVVAAEQKVEAMRAEAADASAHAEDSVNKAQANAEEQEKAASSALAKARDAYKEEGRLRLSILNKEFSEVAAKVSKAPAAVKLAIDKPMLLIPTQQKAVAKDITAFDTATLESFRATKAALDKDLAELKASIHTVRSKVP